MSDVGELVKVVKDWPARYFVALAGVAALLLGLANTRWADVFGLRTGPPWLRLALTICVLAFSAIATAKWAGDIASSRRRRAAARKRDASFENDMRNLTPDEYAVLAAFVDSNKRTCGFVMTSGHVGHTAVAHALAMRGYLYSVSEDRNSFFTTYTYGIQEPVLAFFKAHGELLAPGRRVRDAVFPPLPDQR